MSILGLHINKIETQHLDVMPHLKSTWQTLLNPKREAIQDIKERGGGKVLSRRYIKDGEVHAMYLNGDPTKAGRDLANFVIADRANSGDADILINEPPCEFVWQIERLAQCEIAFMETLEGAGMIAGVGAFSSGNLQLPRIDGGAAIRAYEPVLRRAHAKGHKLVTHCYTATRPALGGVAPNGVHHDPVYWLLRWRKEIFPYLRSRGIPIPKVLITEFMLDLGFAKNHFGYKGDTVGWKTPPPYGYGDNKEGADKCADDILAMVKELAKDPEVEAINLYCAGDNGTSTWQSFMVDGYLLNKLATMTFPEPAQTSAPPSNPNPQQPPTTTPQPPTTPSPLPPRILVDMPDFVTIQDATVAQGQQFWRATKVERRRQGTSGGLHHIFSVEPHNPAISTLVEWVDGGNNKNVTIPHDKPLNEPAANFSMFGAVYTASIKDGSKPSDKIVGMRMPQGQHESYYITWKLETMPSTTPTPQPPTPNPSPIRWDKVVWAFEQAARTLKNEGYVTSHDWVLQSDSYKYAKAQRDGSSAPTPIEPSPLVIDRTRRSPNFNERPTNAAPDVVVLHHTGGSTQSSLNWLSNPASGVSTHYLISKEGKIYEMVSEAKRAWHCGESVFKGRNDVNDFSIGIEIANAGDGVDPYPKAQQDAIVALLSDLKRRGIKRDNVTTHKAIALPKGRKADPSANFPLDEIMGKVYG